MSKKYRITVDVEVEAEKEAEPLVAKLAAGIRHRAETFAHPCYGVSAKVTLEYVEDRQLPLFA